MLQLSQSPGEISKNPKKRVTSFSFFKLLLLNYWLPVQLKSKRSPDWLNSSFLLSPHCSAALRFFSAFNFPRCSEQVPLVSCRWPSVHTFVRPRGENSRTISGPFTDTSVHVKIPLRCSAGLIMRPVSPLPSLHSCLHSFLLHPEVTTMRCLLLLLWLMSPPARSPSNQKEESIQQEELQSSCCSTEVDSRVVRPRSGKTGDAALQWFQ